VSAQFLGVDGLAFVLYDGLCFRALSGLEYCQDGRFFGRRNILSQLPFFVDVVFVSIFARD
jgi:hypothetical protein